MPNSDYVPSTDGDFYNFAIAFGTAITAAPTDYGLVAGDATAYNALLDAFVDAYGAANEPSTRTTVTIATKNDARRTLEAKLRQLVGVIRASGAADAEDLAALGLDPIDVEPTQIGAPASKPVIVVEKINNLSHRLRIRDELTPLANAKPAGTIGAEIYVSYGDEEAPTLADATYVKLGTRALVDVEHAPSAKNTTAWFMACWINARGERGPTADQVSATVAG